MNIDYEVTPLFPTLVHNLKIENFAAIKPQLLNYIYGEIRKDPFGIKRSNMGGWQSKNRYNDFENPLRSFLIESLVAAFNQHSIFKDTLEIALSGLWINVNKNKSYNEAHVHPESHLAGVLWVKTPPNCGDLVLYSPFSYSNWDEMSSYSQSFQYHNFQYPNYTFTPEEGKIILFPSSQFHGVNPSQSKEDRISVAFNVLLK